MAKRRGARGRVQPARSIGTRSQRTRVLVVLGGVKTEAEYMDFIKGRVRGTGVKIELVKSGRDPLSLVGEASSLASEDRREAKKSGDTGNVYDAVWVVSDVDDFGAAIPEAVAAAESVDIKMAVSNPCFEVWLLWHKEDCGYGTTTQVQAQAKKAGVVDGKSIVLAALEGGFDDASQRAKQRRIQHHRNGVLAPDDNASSGMDVLVGDLLRAGA